MDAASATPGPGVGVFSHVFTRDSPGKIEDFYKMDRKMMGEGSYGQVKKGTHVVSGTVRAIKCIDQKKVSDKSRFEEEIHIQQSLDHPNIVKLFEVFKDAQKFYLVMELCTGGELFDRIVEQTDKSPDGTAFGEKDAATYMMQILGAMNYLHSQKFVHRDIKPENFLMENKTKEAQIKVIDFGLAKYFVPGVGYTDAKGVLHPKMKTKAGTPYYVAPEVLEGSYDEKCDVWSCGVINYILMCGYPPFYGEEDKKILEAVRKGKYDFPSPEWDGVSKASKAFIGKMLTRDPSQRLSFAQLLEEPWLLNTRSVTQDSLPKDLHTRLKKFHDVSKMKKAVLTCIATQLNDKDIEELKNTFRALDANHDGTLSIVEITEGMTRHKVDLPENVADIMKTVRDLDTDGSGVIDYTEFIAATLVNKKHIREDSLWAAFRVFDLDGDGKITRQELQDVLKLSSDSEVAAMIREGDFDGDGEIDFKEFCKMMEL